MNCDTATQNVKALLDGELSRPQAWRVRRHIARCAACQKEWEALQRLDDALRSADLFPPQTAVSVAPRPLRHRPALRLAAGLALTALITAFLFVLPLGRQPQNMGVAIAAAISQANTWHFSGWKQMDGKRVPWDIWGRRKPFLFYERVGDNITIDDGAQRLRLFPPNPALNRPVGLVIQTATQQQLTLTDLLGPSAETMVGAWNWRQGGGMFAQTPFRQTASAVSFRRQSPYHYQQGVNANQIYTIRKPTWLPERYQLHFQSLTKQWDTETLVADYDVALPREVASPTLPPGYRTVNLTKPVNTQLSVQANVAALDVQGNIIMQYRTRLAGVLLTPITTFSVTASSDNHQESLYGLRDGVSVRYLHTTLYGMGHPDAQGDIYELYSPLAPLPKSDRLPQQLQVTLDVAPNLQVKDTDFQPEQGPFTPSTRTETLFQKQITQTIPLPKSPSTTSIARAIPKDLNWVFRRDSLQVQVYRARVNYYRMSSDYQNAVYKRVAPGLIRRGILNADGSIPTTRPMDYTALSKVYHSHRNQFKQAQHRQKLEAIVWQKRLIAVTPDKGEDRWTYLNNIQFLAEMYQEVGQPAQMKQTLRQLIQQYQTMPQRGGLPRRQAEYALRTGQFPGDADYKGPS